MNRLFNLHADFEGYNQLSRLFKANSEKFVEKIPLRLIQWFDANMAAPLGAVLDVLEDNLNAIEFDHLDQGIQTILQKNGFLKHFGYPYRNDGYGTTIQYQKMKPEDGRYFYEYVTEQFIDRPELPTMSDGLRKKMTEAMLELFANAKLHSETRHIYTCGQFFPKRHTIEFCIADTGIGFRENFFRRFGKAIPSVDAIQWAVQDKNTTKVDVPGGIGLALLHEFVQLNQGKLQIVSDDGFYQYDGRNEQTKKLIHGFPGTVVNVLFRTDDHHNYSLVNEDDETDLF